jgi:26S proteasome regulatory subunit N2
MVGLVSAAGLVGFLSEPDPDLKVFALRTLDAEVNLLWTEIVNVISQMYVILSWRHSWAFFLHI